MKYYYLALKLLFYINFTLIVVIIIYLVLFTNVIIEFEFMNVREATTLIEKDVTMNIKLE